MGCGDVVVSGPFDGASQGDSGNGAGDGSNGDGGGGFDATPVDCATVIPAGFTRRASPRTFPEVPQLNSPGYFLQPFPNTGGVLGLVHARANQYVAIEFTPPTDLSAYAGLARQFNWLEAQQGGAAVLTRMYASISTCAGDLRVPTANVGPAGDPTLRHGCRNWQLSGGTLVALRGIEYTVDGADAATNCPLVPGQTYYFNVAMVNPNDGLAAGELNCSNSQLTECGIQMKGE